MSNGLATRTALIPEVLPATAYSFEDMQRMAQVAVASGLYRFTMPQAQTLMLLCQSEGIHPIKALAMYDIVDGRPAMKSMYMLARHQAAGGDYEWGETSEKAAECRFSHPKSCPKGITVRYTIDDAKLAGLAGKDNWRKNPGDMLVWRVVSRGVKRSNPACLFGLDVPDPDEQPEVIESTAHKSLTATLAARRESPRESHPPVSETVQELKAAAVAPIVVDRPEPQSARAPEPQSEWGKMIADALAGANEALEKLAQENPGNLELRKPLRAQQVARGILAAYVERGDLDEASLKNEKGKRDPTKEANALSFLWADDQEELESQVAKYIGGKLTALLDSLKPGAAPAQGELAMS